MKADRAMAEVAATDKRTGGATTEHAHAPNRHTSAPDQRRGIRLAPVAGRLAKAAEMATTVELESATTGSLHPAVTRHRLMVADAAASLAAVAVALSLFLSVRPMDTYTLSRHLLLTVATFPAFALGAVLSQMYRARANATTTSEFRNIAKTVAFGTSFLVCLAFAMQMKELSRGWVGLVAAATLTALTIERSVARRIFAGLRISGRMRRRIIIVGTDNHAVRLHQVFEHDPSLGYESIGFVGNRDGDFLFRDRVLGSFADIESILAANDAIGVVMSPSSMRESELNTMTRDLTDAGYHVAISATLRDIDIARLRPQSIDGRSMLYVEPVARSGAPVVAKRIFDVVAASSLLIVTAPIIVLAMAAIKLTSRGPVLFRQTRVGVDGEEFTMSKLRTMVVDAEDQLGELAHLNEADGPLFKIEDDPRITRVGRLLRKTSIDELPQLVAVLRGTMSMVGPRPALPCEVQKWDEETRDRLRVLPGLTGLWQVSGRSDASFDAYKRLDLFYVDNWSMRHDLSICLRTVGVVLNARGAR